MVRIFTCLFLLLLSTAFISFGQNAPYIFLKGTIVNAATGEPISYTTIRLNTHNINTVSNENGSFIFKIPSGNIKDSIYISHVGYRPVAIMVDRHTMDMITIRLQEKTEQLNEVVVKTINPLELLKKAIAQIPFNYPTSPYLINGFCRTTGRKEKNIVDLSEAVFQVYNENYARKNKQLKLIKVRLDKDLVAFNGNDGLYFGERPESIFEDDIVSNAGTSGLLSEEELKNHDFRFKGMVNYNGKEAYKIQFDQKDGIKKSLYKGTMVIEADSLAFLEFDIQRSPKGIQYWELGGGLITKLNLSLARLSINMVQQHAVLTYHKYGNKYYLDHLNGNTAFRVVGGRKQFEFNPLWVKYDFLVTSIDTSGIIPFRKEEILTNNQIIEKKAPDTNTDSTDQFWGNYNLIQPEFNIDSAAKVIRARNETLNYKKTLSDKLAKLKGDKAVRIDSILSFYYQKGQFNGTALVQYDGKVIYKKAFGDANIAQHVPNTGQTQFRIGSTSKQFTAMLIMQLVNEHKLTITDTAGKFLPGYKNGRVTIEQLLTHQSGIPNYTENEKYLTSILSRPYTTDELVQQFCSDSLGFEPGMQFNYSNSGFVVLADIIEQITGKRYADVLTERIFTPLGMTHSYFGPGNHDSTYMAVGYINGEQEITYPVQNEAGAGGIVSTAEDLLLWHKGLSAGTILPVSQAAELWKPRVDWKEWDAWYGYGWMIDRMQFSVSKKHTIQYHPGTEVGFYDMLVRQPDKDIFIILLNNKSDFPRFDITDLVLEGLNQ